MLELGRLSTKNIEGISALNTTSVLGFDIEAIREQANCFQVSEETIARKCYLKAQVSEKSDEDVVTLVDEIIGQMRKARDRTFIMQQRGSKFLQNAVIASLNITRLNREKADNQYWLAFEHPKR